MATSCEELTHWKRLWCWEGLGAGGEGDNRGWDGWISSLTRWTWVWVNSGSWWWTGRPWRSVIHGVAKSRTRLSDWTELNWEQDKNKKTAAKLGVLKEEFPRDQKPPVYTRSEPNISGLTRWVTQVPGQWQFAHRRKGYENGCHTKKIQVGPAINLMEPDADNNMSAYQLKVFSTPSRSISRIKHPITVLAEYSLSEKRTWDDLGHWPIRDTVLSIGERHPYLLPKDLGHSHCLIFLLGFQKQNPIRSLFWAFLVLHFRQHTDLLPKQHNNDLRRIASELPEKALLPLISSCSLSGYKRHTSHLSQWTTFAGGWIHSLGRISWV